MALLLFACVGLASTILIVLAYRRRWRWTGFAEIRRTKAEEEDLQPAKTLWDWLQLLVIPLALAGLAFLLTKSQNDRDQRREDQRAAIQRATAADAAREEALRAYLTQMSALMLDRNLLRSRRGTNVRAVARTLTLTALRRVDGERRGLVVRFLNEARLLDSRDPKVYLANASLENAQLRGADLERAFLSLVDLDGADLENAFLEKVVLQGADLRRADLRKAFLEKADLQYADIPGANLRGAILPKATLEGADLRGADLRGADLRGANSGLYMRGADLRGADLTGADLTPSYTAELRRADLRGAQYDAATDWPEDFDPVAAGARKVR